MPETTITFEELAAAQDLHRGVASMYSPSKSSKSAPSSSKSVRNSFRSPAKGNPGMDSLLAAASIGWRRSGPSTTGTCVRLESSSMSPTGGIASVTGAKMIPPLILTWRGDEPLDRLHICIKVSSVQWIACVSNDSFVVSNLYSLFLGNYDIKGYFCSFRKWK